MSTWERLLALRARSSQFVTFEHFKNEYVTILSGK